MFVVTPVWILLILSTILCCIMVNCKIYAQAHTQTNTPTHTVHFEISSVTNEQNDRTTQTWNRCLKQSDQLLQNIIINSVFSNNSGALIFFYIKIYITINICTKNLQMLMSSKRRKKIHFWEWWCRHLHFLLYWVLSFSHHMYIYL